MESIPLLIGIAAVALVVWWLVKKVVRMAIWAAIVGVVAWIWWFQIR